MIAQFAFCRGAGRKINTADITREWNLRKATSVFVTSSMSTTLHLNHIYDIVTLRPFRLANLSFFRPIKSVLQHK